MFLDLARFRPAFFSSSLFTLKIEYKPNTTHIVMSLNGQKVNTKDIPLVFPILKKQLPSVFSAECFNDQNIPFEEEVTKTEIGHLFEHILLEYLCLYKVTLSGQYATYSGVTNWNWKKDTRGTFHIRVEAGIRDKEIFANALEQSIRLLKAILTQSAQPAYIQAQIPAVNFHTR